MSNSGQMPRERPSGLSARAVAAWLESSTDAKTKQNAKVHGPAVAMALRPPMIASRFALMKVSPSQASPRMPTIAVMPDWQVLHLGTSATGALVTVKITAATASMTIAMAIGIER